MSPLIQSAGANIYVDLAMDFGFAVEPAGVDLLQAVQDLDLLAEFAGQRPGGLLGSTIVEA